MTRDAKIWEQWRDRARTEGDSRWAAACGLPRKQLSGKDWLKSTKQCLADLAEIGIIQRGDTSRLRDVPFVELAHSTQDNLKKVPLKPKRVFAFAIAPLTGESLRTTSLPISPCKRLQEGKLSLQVIVDEHARLPIGMNIQLRGLDPARSGRSTYIRYDLDPVALSESMGPVTHFNAHWHTGDDPDGDDAEVHDPRLPSLPLDPVAVLQFLIETYYPGGPDELV